MAERRNSEEAIDEMAEIACRRAYALGHPVIAVGFLNGKGFRVIDQVGQLDPFAPTEPGELLPGDGLEQVGSVPFERTVEEIGLEDALEEDPEE
jgi:hypothetical protein